MKYTIALLLLAIPVIGHTQPPDTTAYPKYITTFDTFGNSKQVAVVTAPQILIVEGDSIYTIPDEYTLRTNLSKKTDRLLTIITAPDSIRKFADNRIKAVFIIEQKKKGK